jgi:short-subunit dehydrogenase
MQLDGKRVLITGAGSGIGRALAIACAEKGASLILTGRRREALAETAGLLPESAKAKIVPVDIATEMGRRALCVAVDDFGGIDVLVNNAGQVLVGRVEDYDDAALESMIRTNVQAPIALARDLLPALRRSASPCIVNVGSMFGDIAHPMFAAYSAAKFALRGFSDALRRELASEGISVVYVAPRGARTPAAGAFEKLVAPFGMKLDEPEVVAALIVRAIESDAPAAYAKGPERFFVLVQRLMPRLIDRELIARFAKISGEAGRDLRTPNRAGPPSRESGPVEFPFRVSG